MTPAISTIIPVFDEASFVAETVASLLRQAIRSAEIIIVDTSATDTTAEVTIRRHHHGANLWLGGANPAGGQLDALTKQLDRPRVGATPIAP